MAQPRRRSRAGARVRGHGRARAGSGRFGSGLRAIPGGVSEAAPLDDGVCYRALRTRDRRFDGRFFVGVSSTGVYCRPVCPARTPRPENCTFHRCAAAAQEAGFRPCLRCRPEAAPGTPAWLGPSATVARALRLIGAGALDDGSLPELAERLGVGERHLRRLFRDHVGASPQAVAQTRRLLFARRLLRETRLPITELALASGFQSHRRFHAAVREAFGCSPRELRKPHLRLGGDSGLELRLSYRPPFDWDGLLSFLELRAIPGVERVEGGTYWRTLEEEGVVGAVSVHHDAERRELVARVFSAEPLPLIRVGERVRRLFDLSADPEAIGAELGHDERLRKLLRVRPGVRVPGAWDPFEIAVRAVLGQQVTVRGARTLAGRVVASAGSPLPAVPGIPEGLTHTFPAPEALRSAGLGGLGLTGARERALRALAEAVAVGDVALDGSVDPAEAVAGLEALPGLGPWTACYVAMRGLGEPDAFPEGDLGLRRALAANGALPSPRELHRASEAWRPWRAYAAILLWSGDPGPRRPA
jgi:AraC family transcriptional regulator of adaptative response / DNA-3-methyladenine glycosylase II